MEGIISKEEQEQIGVAMSKIAKQENLKLKSIKFRALWKGTKRRKGVCTHHKKQDYYTIILHTVSATFVEDVNGLYRSKDGKRWSRKTLGTPISFEEIVKTAAHELAHIKYFQHNLKHKIYTNDIEKMLISELGELWKRNSNTQSTDTLTTPILSEQEQ